MRINDTVPKFDLIIGITYFMMAYLCVFAGLCKKSAIELYDDN